MKWVLIGVAVLAAIVLVVTVVGLLLPKNHTAQRSAKINVAPATIWAELTAIEAFTAWRPDVKKVERISETRWVEEGGNGRITFERVEAEAPRRLVTRIADDTLPFGGTWTYELVADGAGTRVSITENGEGKNPIFRFMSKLIFGHTKTLDDYLRALAKKHGEEVSPS